MKTAAAIAAAVAYCLVEEASAARFLRRALLSSSTRVGFACGGGAGELFYHQDGKGTNGCRDQAGCPAKNGVYDGSKSCPWPKMDVSADSYFQCDRDSFSMTSEGDLDCRTVATQGTCQFDVGDGGVTQIDFDYTISDGCRQTDDRGFATWLGFWMYNEPWDARSEVDFIEGNWPGHGMGGGCDNKYSTNFAGNGNQVCLPDSMQSGGHITAKFSGNDVTVGAASSTLKSTKGYFLVLDTATGGSKDCKITIKNLAFKGTVPDGQCGGVTISS